MVFTCFFLDYEKILRMFRRIAAKCVTLQVGNKAFNINHIINVHEEDISTVKCVCELELAGWDAVAAFSLGQVAADNASVISVRALVERECR